MSQNLGGQSLQALASTQIPLLYHFIPEKWHNTQKSDFPSEMNTNDSSSKKGLIAGIAALGENKQKYLPVLKSSI